MNKHTPGPWIRSADRKVLTDNGVSSVTLAQVVQREGVSWYEAEANLRLIAAAPDLLTALQDAADAVHIHAPDSWVLVQARAAIAKATGEQA